LKSLLWHYIHLFFKGGKKKEYYSIKRAIEAELDKLTWSDRPDNCLLNYSSKNDDYHVPVDFERALDCLRLSFIASDLNAGTIMPWGEPVGEMLDCRSGWTLEKEHEFTHWIFVDVTDRCNLTCNFCYRPESSDNNISVDDFEKILDKFKDSKGNKEVGVTLGGGEPTEHPKLERLLEIAREKYDFITMTTNGTNPELVKKLGSYLDGVCVSAPFVYNENPFFNYSLSAEQISSAVKEIAENVKRACISTIVTNEMQPDDVFKVTDFAKKASATDILFLMYKPGKKELVPSREEAREILEKILEVHYKVMPSSIDACFATRTVWKRCKGLTYVSAGGKLLDEYCPFSGKDECIFVK